MTTSTSPALRSRLQLALLNSRQKQTSLLQKGFTLVELMIVIVIVGVLSAVALPNFLSQTEKAKMTEAKTLTSASLKEYYSERLSDPQATMPCPADTANFTFDCDSETDGIVATLKGSSPVKTLTATVNLGTGVIEMESGESG